MIGKTAGKPIIDTEAKGVFTLPAVNFAPFLAAGMIIAYFVSVSVWFVVPTIVLAAAAAVKRIKHYLCLVGFAAGLLLMSVHVNFYCNPILRCAGDTVRADVYVSEILTQNENYFEFLGNVELDGLRFNVRLSGEMLVEEGDTADVTIELETPDPQYLVQNLAKGVLLSGNIVEYHSVSTSGFGVVKAIKAVRRYISAVVWENLQGESGETAMALMFGEDEYLSQTFSEQLKICGIAHYTAVSGTHFAILAAVVLRIIPSRKRRLKSLMSILTAAAAVIFFGATASVLRASTMFIISAAAPLFLRKSETLNTLCLAVSVLLLLSPGAVLDIGFAMSVFGVFGAGVAGPRISAKIAAAIPERAGFLKPVITAVACSFSALVCTAPIAVCVFKGVSLCAVITSIITLPLLTVAMTFTILLGIMNSGVLAVPVDLSMKLIITVVKFFGSIREMYISLDFAGAWVLSAVCAVLLTLGAFGTLKSMRWFFSGVAVLVLISNALSVHTCQNRSEIRFVGNYRTSAAVIFQGNEAVVFISGSGSGLADDISRCLREHGAVRISCIAAFEADYSGAVSIKELTEMVDTRAVYTSEIAAMVLDNAKICGADANFSINGTTFACDKASSGKIDADIVLYHGTFRTAKSSALLGIFFAGADRVLPDNSVNIRTNSDFTILLNADALIVRVEYCS